MSKASISSLSFWVSNLCEDFLVYLVPRELASVSPVNPRQPHSQWLETCLCPSCTWTVSTMTMSDTKSCVWINAIQPPSPFQAKLLCPAGTLACSVLLGAGAIEMTAMSAGCPSKGHKGSWAKSRSHVPGRCHAVPTPGQWDGWPLSVENKTSL